MSASCLYSTVQACAKPLSHSAFFSENSTLEENTRCTEAAIN